MKIHTFIFLLIGGSMAPPIFSSAQFTTLWTQTSNPTVAADNARAITIDGTGIYVAGDDNNGDGWRIEKRDLTTGVLIAAFGTGGVVTSNPSLWGDIVNAMTADTSGIYVAGYDIGTGGGGRWRIEKRDLITGALIAAFGTGGIVTSNPSAGAANIYAITSDASGIYVAGVDNSPGNGQWRIEKRDLTTGALIAAFGTGGVVTSNPSGSTDMIQAITADASGIYVAGVDINPGDGQWRIEKRDLTTGAFIAGFGAGGVVTSNPSGSIDRIQAITSDASGIYVAGYDNSPGNPQWRIEKRDLTTGALIAAFGTVGVVTNNPSASTNVAYAITSDASAIYVAGYDNSPGNPQWRIEKRDLTTGALLCTQTSNSTSTSIDVAYTITSDTSGIYVAGYDNGSGNDQWHIEKYDGVCFQTSVEPLSLIGILNIVTIYPTISSGLFFISGDLTDAEILVYSVMEEKVYSTSNVKHLASNEIDLSSQPQGTYFIQIKTEQGTINQKLIISK